MKKKDLLLFLISLCILVVAWIALSIYHNSVTPTIPETATQQVEPITPNFDTETIDKLKNRRTIPPAYEGLKPTEKVATSSAESTISIPTVTTSTSSSSSLATPIPTTGATILP